MKSVRKNTVEACPLRLARLSVLIGAMFAAHHAHAAVGADISNTPLANTSDIAAKPNLMFILDDSGSMNLEYMPDNMNSSGKYGYRSSQCNGVAYNPNFNYTDNRPLRSDGAVYPNADFSSAMDDGFQMNFEDGVQTRTSSTSVKMATGDLVFKLSGTPYSTTVGAVIGIAKTSDNTLWMKGTIKSWSSSSMQLTVAVTAVVGDGEYSSWTIGKPAYSSLAGSVYYKYTGGQPALSWSYSAATRTYISNTYSQECLSSVGSSPGSSVFSQVTVNPGSSEAQNYANWYSYYRKRILLMRSVAGRSFVDLDDKYRVGFSTISETKAAASSKFLDVSDFDVTQKTAFYKKFYSADANSWTPLRAALSKAGRYFANQATGQAVDPVQYACQRNFTLLSTDGYWNTNDETATYGPFALDGNEVGQQDGDEEKPRWDGQKAKVTTSTPYSTLIHQQAQYTRTYTYTVTGGTYKHWIKSTCSGSKKKLETYTGVTGTEVDTATVTDLEDVTGTTTQQVVTIDGVVQSTTYDTPSPSGTPTVTGSSAGAATLYSFSMGSYTGKTTGSCTTPTTDTVSGGTKTLTGTSDSGSKARTILSQSPISATGSSTVTASTTTGGQANTLADVAEYYYDTDLRSPDLGNCTGAKGVDVCNNEVPPSGDRDLSSQQHMTTFTMGLGVGGTLTYDRSYLTQTTGDYVGLKQGTVTWPVPSMTGGDPTNVDDLWHAAVNGRGQYFATTDPTSLADAISTVLTSVSKAKGSSAAASTSSLRPVPGEDNMVFLATYTTIDWVGDLVAYSIDAETGAIENIDKPLWSAQSKMDGITAGDRSVYYLQPGAATPTLRDFKIANLQSDGYDGYFSGACSKTLKPDQCATLTTSQKGIANSAANLVNYLRGDRTYEDYTDSSSGAATKVTIYRKRAHLLGDIVNGAPQYVGSPPFSYADAGYSDFAANNKNRMPVVYVAANDGMLHAIKADKTAGGGELWAYVPSFVMPNLYQLADTAYADNHRFYADGSPEVADIKVGSSWKTILVAGLNSGGAGYYALDVTDPQNPKPLWEFTDTNMGYTYGTPIITKRADGTWVVVVTSGYNNTSGDGNGHLYVLNANTGKLLLDIPTYSSGSTPAGTAAAPSNLGKINAWVEALTDNTATRFYGGDMQGNLWRFDVDGLLDPKGKALLLATFKIGTTPQPITTKPETAVVTYGGVTYPVVAVGTGRYLGTSDIVDDSTQSIYVIKDPLGSTGLGSVRARSDIVEQTLTDATADDKSKIRTVSSNAVDWSTKIGWMVDLPSSGERVAVDMALQYSTLVVASAIPGTDECRPSGGSSWLYAFDVTTGRAANGATAAGSFLGNFLVVGLTWAQNSGGGNDTLYIPDSSGGLTAKKMSRPTGSGAGSSHRTSWRELAD